MGYSKYDYQNKETDDSRNGYSKKTVTSSLGEIDLDIPRDRKGEFELFGDDSGYLCQMDEYATARAYKLARQARFEYGETPKI